MGGQSTGSEELRVEFTMFRTEVKSGFADVGAEFAKTRCDMHMLYVRTVKWFIGTAVVGTVIGVGGFTAIFRFLG